MKYFLPLAILSVAAASAQSLSVGVIAGAPLTDLENRAQSPKITAGGSLRINLPLSLRVEIDALYRPNNFTTFVVPKIQAPFSSNEFRFPVLLQYRFSLPLLQPFIEGGLSYDHITGAKSILLLHSSDAAIVLGAGADVKVPFFRVSGELRYTRKTVSNFANISNLNQAEVLFGVHF